MGSKRQRRESAAGGSTAAETRPEAPRRWKVEVLMGKPSDEVDVRNALAKAHGLTVVRAEPVVT